jgi:hypothetical protein
MDGRPSQNVQHRGSSAYKVSKVRGVSSATDTLPSVGRIVRSTHPT